MNSGTKFVTAHLCSNQFWVIYPKYLLEYLCKSPLKACQSPSVLKIANARLMSSAIHFRIHEFDVLHKLWLLGYLPHQPPCKLRLAKKQTYSELPLPD